MFSTVKIYKMYHLNRFQSHGSVAFGTITSTTIHLQNFPSSQTETWSPLSRNSPCPPKSASLWHPPSTFCLYELDNARSSHKWHHTAFVLL